MSLVAPAHIGELLPRLRQGGDALRAEIERVLERTERVEPVIRAFVEEENRAGRLRQAAESLEGRYPDPTRRPSLFGLLVGVKDIFRVNGLPTRVGSKLSPDLFAGPQAGIVTKLLDAGALIAGKTVTTEFAYFAPGPTRNPWNPEHTPGGSSSGSAAAVAAGLCHAALGTQTIGSIIRPAAFCGIVGFKPSYGRVSNDGVFPFSVSADHVGVFASNVAGVKRMAAVVCRSWKSRASAGSSGIRGTAANRSAVGNGSAGSGTGLGIRVGVPSEAFLSQADDESRRAFDEALRRLEAAGCEIVSATLLDDIADINAAHQDLIAAEFAEVHAAWFEKQRTLYSKESTDLVLRGREVGSARASEARKGRGALRERVAGEWQRLGIDILASPATATAAPRGISSTGSPIMNLPWTYAGVPAVTVPCGLNAAGLPLGLQLSGCYDADEALLQHAARIETLVDDGGAQ